jgi:predicted ATPase with chaperone activity
VLRVGRTIADLEGEKRTPPAAIAEALGGRDDWSGGATAVR